MGNRTVVVLYTDQTSEWSTDPDLGRKIMIGMNECYMSRAGDRTDLGYGRVVECTHADTHTLALIEGYRFNALAHSFWQQGQAFDRMKEDMLKAWADKLGYRLVRKSVIKEAK